MSIAATSVAPVNPYVRMDMGTAVATASADPSAAGKIARRATLATAWVAWAASMTA
jgi:hypothetical protein